jgi:hypothetical protein
LRGVLRRAIGISGRLPAQWNLPICGVNSGRPNASDAALMNQSMLLWFEDHRSEIEALLQVDDEYILSQV